MVCPFGGFTWSATLVDWPDLKLIKTMVMENKRAFEMMPEYVIGFMLFSVCFDKFHVIKADRIPKLREALHPLSEQLKRMGESAKLNRQLENQ